MAFQLDIGFTSLAGTKGVNEDFAAAEADFAKAAQLDPKNGLYARWLAKTQKRRGIAI